MIQTVASDELGLAMVAELNRRAWALGTNPALRRVAAIMTQSASDVPVQAPTQIGRWLRRNVIYTHDAWRFELAQGPFSLLRTRTGDCDCLAYTWSCLCLSIGVPAWVCVVGTPTEDRVVYDHAVGWAPTIGAVIELTDDRRYGGAPGPLVQRYLAPGRVYTYFDPVADKLVNLGEDSGGIHDD